MENKEVKKTKSIEYIDDMKLRDMTLYELLYTSMEENEFKNLVAKKIEFLESEFLESEFLENEL